MTTFPLTVVGIYHQWCHFFRRTIIELAKMCTSASVYQSTSTMTQLYQMRRWGGGKDNLHVTLFHGPQTEILQLSGAHIWCHLRYLKAGRGALCWRQAKNPIYTYIPEVDIWFHLGEAPKCACRIQAGAFPINSTATSGMYVYILGFLLLFNIGSPCLLWCSGDDIIFDRRSISVGGPWNSVTSKLFFPPPRFRIW